MGDDSKATRRSVLAAAGVTLGTATFGSVSHAATREMAQDDVPVSVDWYNTYADSDAVTDVQSVFDVDGGYVVVGGGRITKLATDGETERSNALPVERDSLEDSARTSDGNYLHVGSEFYEEPASGQYGFVVKTDERGNELWRWSNEGEPNVDISQFNAAVAGPNGGGYAFGHANDPPLGVRFDSDGDVQWKNTWDTGETFDDGVEAAIAATDGGAIVHDSFAAARVTPDGSLDWVTDLGDRYLFDVIRRPEGGYVVSAAILQTGVESDDEDQPLLLSLDERGEVTRATEFEVPNPADAQHPFLHLHLARTEAGFVIGSTYKKGGDEDDFDAWALGLTSDGEQRWYLRPGDDSNYDQTAAIHGSERSVVLGGEWEGANDEDGDDGSEAFLSRLTEGSDGEQPGADSPTLTPTPNTPTDTETATPTPTDTGPSTDAETETPSGTASETGTSTETETNRGRDTRPDTRTVTQSETVTATETESPTPTATSTGVDATPSPASVETLIDRQTTDVGQPGFGVVSAVAALLAAARLATRRD